MERGDAPAGDLAEVDGVAGVWSASVVTTYAERSERDG